MIVELKENINLLGSIIANVNNLLLISIFIARIYHYHKIEHVLGIVFIVSILPLMWMFLKAIEMSRPFMYFLQLGLMISFIIAELILDYILKLEFRQNRSIVIPYVMLFYASFGGMIGIDDNYDYYIFSNGFSKFSNVFQDWDIIPDYFHYVGIVRVKGQPDHPGV